MTAVQPAQPNWGIHFPRPAADSGGLALVTAPLAAELVVALDQHIGLPARPLVKPGDTVRRGEPLAEPDGAGLSAWIHAPADGVVTQVENRPVGSHGSSLCVVITTNSTATRPQKTVAVTDPYSLSATELRRRLTRSGIVGLGGAVFPTHAKLEAANNLATLIINGVECEPHISCDDALMQDQTGMILAGARILLHVTGAQQCLIAVKANSPALVAMQAGVKQLNDDRFQLRTIAAVYPAGDESQLIRLLTGREVPNGTLPTATGLLCQNVATVAAVADFILNGNPLTERIVTVGGSGVTNPVNVRARIGTPIAELIQCAGGYTPEATRLIMGGPMMGIALPDDERPLTKACNSLYVAARSELAAKPQPMPCIRCGECAGACPVQLTPQLLLVASVASDAEQLQQLGVNACMECGACDYVCPSHIALTRTFGAAKQMLRIQAFEQARGDKAELRFAAHTERRDQRAKAEQARLDEQVESLDDAKAALAALLKRTGDDK